MVTKPTPVVQALLDQMPSDEMKDAVLDLDMVQDVGPQAVLENLYLQQLADLQDCVLDLNEWTTDPAWAAAVATYPQLVQQLMDMFNGGTVGSHLYPQQLLELPNWPEVGGALADIQLTFDF
jgi:hypothetical protein